MKSLGVRLFSSPKVTSQRVRSRLSLWRKCSELRFGLHFADGYSIIERLRGNAGTDRALS